MVARKQAFAQKTAFAGIDVQKTTYSVCIVCESEIVGKASMPADAQTLGQELDWLMSQCGRQNTFQYGMGDQSSSLLFIKSDSSCHRISETNDDALIMA